LFLLEKKSNFFKRELIFSYVMYMLSHSKYDVNSEREIIHYNKPINYTYILRCAHYVTQLSNKTIFI